MTQTQQLTTADHFVELTERAAANGASDAPPWIKELRQSAIRRFVEMGFPTTRQEAWRFTDLKPVLRHAFEVAGPNAGRVSQSDIEPFRIDPAIPMVVMVNGRFDADLSTLGSAEGVNVQGMHGALATDDSVLRSKLSQRVQADGTAFASLNGAFTGDGTVVQVAADATAGPIQILHVSIANGETPEISNPRTLIVVGNGGSATIVESYVTIGSGVTWTNSVTDLLVGRNASLECYRVQDESIDAFHTASTWSSQERDSRLSNLIFVFGGAITRHDVVSVLDGEGAESTLNGLSVLGGRQHVDYHTALDHAKPYCNSWEYFNGVFDDMSRGVFNGRIIVRPGAQKTDAKQTNNNLLMSPTARADSQPQLEIYADDVKCTHGATLGPIDEAHLFYMQSRGLSREHATSLLTIGFVSEILNGVELAPLRAKLDGMVQDRLRSTPSS